MSRNIFVLGLIGLGLLGGCGGGGNTALTTVPTAHLAITLSATTVIADTPFSFTVTALDATNVVVPTYVGTAQITTSDKSAMLPANATLTQGVGKFTVTFGTAGRQTITASDTVGDATSGTSASITVSPAPAPTIKSISPTNAVSGGPGFTLTVNGSNFVPGSVVQWNGGNRSTAFVNSSQVTAQISAGDIAAVGTAAVTVFNPPAGGGSSNTLTFTITTQSSSRTSVVVDRAGNFAYVVNQRSDHVSMYSISATTGTLTSLGTIAAGASPDSVAVDPSGQFAYVANAGSGVTTGDVSMYKINTATGALTSIGLTSAEIWPVSVAIDPTGHFVYIANIGPGLASASGSVSMYTINTTTGTLTPIGTIAAGGGALSVAVDPSGSFAYVANGYPDKVSMYTVNTTTGVLTSIGTVAAGTSNGSLYMQIAFDPSGNFAYVVADGCALDLFGGSVSMYSIKPTAGVLTSLGSPVAAGTCADSLAVDPLGKFAYVTNSQDNNISTYSINASTGILTFIGTTATGFAPTSIAIHPTGKYAYVTNSGSNSVSMYRIDGATGALALIGTIGT